MALTPIRLWCEEVSETLYTSTMRWWCTSSVRVIPPLPKLGTMLPYYTIVRGRCHDSAPCVLPARDPGTLVALCHTALRLAKPIRSVTSEASRTCAHHVQAQTLQRAQTLRGSDT